ncbi:hypothetical protein AB0D54_15815 [Streptomyces xanthophaeus]|uniref:hypothetical protein n=1 Tax=Streptomyces xanthophaeus TaxID=67385 RepID=UPI00343B1ECD
MDENTAPQPPAADASCPGVFAYCLTDQGLRWLWSLLDTGRYVLRAPEEGALLAVAWLLRAGEDAAAEELLEQLRPFAAGTRFAPRPADRQAPGPDAVHRRTAGEVSGALARRAERPAVEAQREALAVWGPFEDELLGHWLSAEDAGPHWLADGSRLLERYRALATAHVRCTKHLDPKSNAAVLRRALEERVAGRELTPALAGQLRHAVASMVAKRGRPGSAEHTRLRRDQARQAAQPGHHELAALVVRRLSHLDVGGPVTDPGSAVAPVTPEEAAETGMPAGALVPPAVRAVAGSALGATPGTLAERSVLPSAEALAELAPQLSVTYTAAGYADASLRALVAATYRARRGSRHGYGWNPDSGAWVSELPWLRALAGWSTDPAVQARSALRALGELSVHAFPGDGLPDRLLWQLSALARKAGLAAPFATVPFADRRTGKVSADLLPAARDAAELLRDTPYARYHGIDYGAVRQIVEAGDPARFARLCAERAGHPPHGADPVHALAAEAAVMEQARILTSCGLATLVRHVGFTPRPGWDALARGAFRAAARRSASAARSARAWRQLLFHFSACTGPERAAVLAWIDAETARYPAGAAARLAPAVTGLRRAAGAR